MSLVEACLEPVALSELRPTRTTVGFREVAQKRRLLRAFSAADRMVFLASRPAPTVIGPGGQHFLIDQHHLTRALLEEGERYSLTAPAADFSSLGEAAFWERMMARRWVRPLGRDGGRIDYTALPQSVADLADDPYRSLAAAVRRAGGFAKDPAPFSEFAWADFFRRRIAPRAVAAALDGALAPILALARSADARDLPGFRGG